MIQIEKAFKTVEDKLGGQLKVEPWLAEIERLSERVEALESKTPKSKK